MPVNIDRIHSVINIAIIDHASSSLQDLRKTEAAISQSSGPDREQLETVAKTQRAIALSRLDVIMSYLRGDFAVTDTASLIKAAKLEGQEPEFIKNRKLVTDLTAENTKLKKEVEELQTKVNSEAPWACPQCSRRFTSEKGLRRHEASHKDG